MSLFTRDKIWFSADKRTYWIYDPGSGAATLYVDDVAVLSATSSPRSECGNTLF